MSRIADLLASLRTGKRGVAALAAGGLVVVVAGALVANPFGAPGATPGVSSPSTGPTAGQSADGSLPAPSPTDVPSVPPSEGAIVGSDLDGVLTDPAHAHRLPIFVSIDDSGAARPQAGFNATSVVWQSPVDGYVPRYLLVFQELDATAIGPVRSARFFFAHWAAEVDGALAHFGGDRDTLKWIRHNTGTFLTNVDGIGSGGPAFHRITARIAPHNAYTAMAALYREALQLGGSARINPDVYVRPFRDDVAPDQYGSIRSLSIPYSSETINYTFDPKTDAYKRSIGASPQIDTMDHKQVMTRTVVVLYMPFHTDTTIEQGHERPVLGFIGSGRAVVYSEGQAVEATWSKPTEMAPTKIIGADGQDIAFVRGRIFFQVVPIGTKVEAS